MIKRGNNRNLTTESDSSKDQNTTTRSIGTITDENLTESFQEAREVVPPPVFHIHIHVPPNSKPNTSKMYLPRIQPIIHLHYDELMKKRSDKMLKSRGSHQSGELTGNGIITSTPHRVLRNRKKTNNDLETKGNSIPEIAPKETQKSDSESEPELELELADQLFNDSSNDSALINNNAHSSPVAQNENPLKLKEAVVILKDICKSKSYKDRTTESIQNEQSPIQSSTSNEMKNSICQIKTEEDSFSSRAHVPALSEKQIETSGDGGGGVLSNSECPERESSGEEEVRKGESLVSLVEGCNFSEILKKFRGKNSQIIADSLKNSKFLAKKKNEAAKTEFEESVAKVKDRDFLPPPNPLVTGKKFVIVPSHNEKEDSPNVPTKDTHSGETEIELSRDPTNQESPGCAEESHNSNRQGVQESTTPVDGMTDEMKCWTKDGGSAEDDDTGAISDSSVITTGSNVSAETVEFNSQQKWSNVVVKKEFDSSENNKNSLVDKEDENFEGRILEEGFTVSMSEKGKNEKRQQQFKSHSKEGPTAKKVKQSVTPQKPAAKERNVPNPSPVREGYIPLNVSGPTKFAIASLPDVQPYKTHDAKNFKNEMLFGKRVNRFSNAKQLWVNKMKKQVGRRSD